MPHCLLVNRSVFFIPGEDKTFPSIQILFIELWSHLPFCPARDDRPRFFVFIPVVTVSAYHDQHFVIWNKARNKSNRAVCSVLIHLKGGAAAQCLVLLDTPYPEVRVYCQCWLRHFTLPRPRLFQYWIPLSSVFFFFSVFIILLTFFTRSICYIGFQNPQCWNKMLLLSTG